jgi:hypothetical protein
LAELFDSIHAVFDADPAGEVDAFELGEDGVVVVEALADLAVAEALGVAEGDERTMLAIRAN